MTARNCSTTMNLTSSTRILKNLNYCCLRNSNCLKMTEMTNLMKMKNLKTSWKNSNCYSNSMNLRTAMRNCSMNCSRKSSTMNCLMNSNSARRPRRGPPNRCKGPMARHARCPDRYNARIAYKPGTHQNSNSTNWMLNFRWMTNWSLIN